MPRILPNRAKHDRPEWTETLAVQFRAAQLPEPVREHRFDAKRRFRFDFAWPDWFVALEFEGGVFSGGAHTRGRHFESDAEKYNLAALAGWTVIRVTERMVRDGRALAWVEQALCGRTVFRPLAEGDPAHSLVAVHVPGAGEGGE